MKNNANEIQDFYLSPLTLFKDDRGELMELFNINRQPEFQLAQLNYVHSLTNTLRGMHLHATHSDYLCVLSGTMILALKDLRSNSSTFGVTALHTLDSRNPQVALVPRGVAHGFYFPQNTMYCYGLSHPWDPAEKYGFRWNAPDAGIKWPMKAPIVSARDAQAGTVAELLQLIKEDKISYD